MRWKFILTITMIGFLTAGIAYRFGSACGSGTCSAQQRMAQGATFATIDILIYWAIVLLVLFGVKIWQQRQEQQREHGAQHARRGKPPSTPPL